MRRLRNFKGYRVFKTAQEFAAAAADYFEWVDNHPLLEDVVSFHQGQECRTFRQKMRPYTHRGLAAHLEIPLSRLDKYRKRNDEFARVMEVIDNTIYTQKYEGAASGLLNASIIARDLGLAEKREVSGPEGGPIRATLAVEELSDAALDEIMRAWDKVNEGSDG